MIGEIVVCVGINLCWDVDFVDIVIEVGDDEFWMLMVGCKLVVCDC